jgi:lipopolysaccharide export system protein LptC
MRTSFMHVVQAHSVFRTDRDVVITEENRELSGRGMEYHNDTKELFLRERVRGRFEPKTK